MMHYDSILKIGDTVWIMKDNKPVERKIVYITITYWKNMEGTKCAGVRYTLDGGVELCECTPWSPGDIIYTHKGELLASL